MNSSCGFSWTSASVAEFLREQGHDVLAVADITPQALDKVVQRILDNHATDLPGSFAVATVFLTRIRKSSGDNIAP